MPTIDNPKHMPTRWRRLKTGVGALTQRIGRLVGALRCRLPGRHIVIPVIIIAWALSGIFIIAPADQGVVYRWGRLARIADPGPHYHWPWPIERVVVGAVEPVQRVELNFGDEPAESQPLADNMPALLTADGQLLRLAAVVQTRISSLEAYLTGVRSVNRMMVAAAQAVLSAVVAGHSAEDVLTTARRALEEKARTALQAMLDRYRCGVQVTALKLMQVQPPAAVQAAFVDMALAREQQRQARVDAEAYAGKLLPLARGQAQQILQTAETYHVRRIHQAQGDVQRFLARLEAYRQGPEITRQRLYLDALADISAAAVKVLLPADQALLPTLSLDRWLPRVAGDPAAPQEIE